jgi:uncharacterized membrane protein
MKRPYKLIATLLLALAALQIVAWSFFKPIRVIAPELNGVTCAGAVCVEHLSTLSRAEELHETAMANIAAKLRPLSSPPRAVFCSTRQCYQSFDHLVGEVSNVVQGGHALLYQ